MTLKTTCLFFSLALIISCTSHKPPQASSKRFKEKDNTAVFTTKFVIVDKKEITLVTHDTDDGAWVFLSDDRFEHFEDVAKIVGLGQIVKIDSSVLEVADLKEGYVAHRSFKGDTWIIEKHQ